jgi:crossover junction endodeoxyribonuclease RusA
MKLTNLEFTFEQPTVALSMNKANSMHWAERRRYLNDWRLALRIAYTKASEHIQGLPHTPISIAFEFTFPRNGRRDPHNYYATIKPLIDELVQCGLVPDDTAEWVSTSEPVLRISDDNLCIVRIKFIKERV